jgi:hypothetical protein
MAIPASTNRNASHDLAVIGVRVLDHAHMTWVAAEVESEHALRAWFKAAGSHHAAPTSHTAQRSTVSRPRPGDLQRLSELTQPYKSGSHTANSRCERANSGNRQSGNSQTHSCAPGEGRKLIPPPRGAVTTRFPAANYALRDSTTAGSCDRRSRAKERHDKQQTHHLPRRPGRRHHWSPIRAGSRRFGEDSSRTPRYDAPGASI